MADRRVIPLIIGIVGGAVIAAAGTVYYRIFAFVPGGRIAGILIIAGTVAALAGLTYAVWQRMREIDKENPDDYRKY